MFRIRPSQDFAINESGRIVLYDNRARRVSLTKDLEAGEELCLSFEELEQHFDYKFKIQTPSGGQWVDRVNYVPLFPESVTADGIKYCFYPCSDSDKLIVVFQAINRKPGYNYVRTLSGIQANRLYIKDDYGGDAATRTSYYLGQGRSFDIAGKVQRFLAEFTESLKIRRRDCIFAGSSKGGFAALYHGYRFGAGYILPGGPQVLLGNFLHCKAEASLHPPILEYLAGGLDEESVVWANRVLRDVILSAQAPFPRTEIHVGQREPHYRHHVLHFLEWVKQAQIQNVTVHLGDYAVHSDLATYYPKFLRDRVESILLGSQPAERLNPAIKDSAEPPAMASSAQDRRAACSICGCDAARFLDFNGPRRKCPDCGSIERQRALASLYRAQQLPGLELEGKQILLIAPSKSEIMFFRQFKGARVQTLDIRALVRPDRSAVGTQVPLFADASVDIVYACHVLAHIDDVEACLSEIHRILKPGGVFINHEPVLKGRHTIEVTNLSDMCRHYGAEAYEKYRIGRFRTFGEPDLQDVLGRHFDPGHHVVTDCPAGSGVMWTLSLNHSSPIESCRVQSIEPIRADEPQPHPLCRFAIQMECQGATGSLADDEWVFFGDHVVRPGDRVEVFARFSKTGARAIPIYDVLEKPICVLQISGSPENPVSDRWDSIGLAETGGSVSLGTVLIPDQLPGGVYLLDKKWLFVVTGDVGSAELVVVLPLSTMHFFNDSCGPSAYSDEFKKQERMTVSSRRPLHVGLLSKACLTGFVSWASTTLAHRRVCYLSDIQLSHGPRQRWGHVMVLVGRSEDWTKEAREAVQSHVVLGGNLLCLSGETMWHDITIDAAAHRLQRDRKRYRWADKLSFNPLRGIIGSNPYDGGFLINLAGDHDPGFGKFRVCRDSSLLEGTGFKKGDVIDLPSVAYDGLPVERYEQGEPVLDLGTLSHWERVELIAFCCGEHSPDRRIGAFAIFKSTAPAGTCIHMGSMGWSHAKGLGRNDDTGRRIQRIVLNAIDMLS
jgi:accessory secretory protein Asp2